MTQHPTRGRRLSLSAPPKKPEPTKIKHDKYYYLVLALIILPIKLVPLSSILYLVQRIYFIHNPIFRNLLMDIYSICEVMFYLRMLILSFKIQRISLPPPHFTPAFAKNLFIRILNDFSAANINKVTKWDQDDVDSSNKYTSYKLKRDDRRSSQDIDKLESLIPTLDYNDEKAIDFREKVRTWFSEASWHDLTNKDIMTWLSWSLLGIPLNETNVPFLDSCVKLVERRTGYCFPLERPKEAKEPTIIRLTLDPVRTQSRPLLLYLLVYFADIVTCFILKLKHGTTIWKVDGEYGVLKYLVRIPKTDKKDESYKRPICLLHGLGFGIPHYGRTFAYLSNKFPNRPIIMPLNPSISMLVFSKRYLLPVSRNEACHGLSQIIEKLGAKDCDAISHSFGTISHTHILKDAPELIRKSTLLDPVTFCLWEGDLCYRFLYKVPKTGLELIMSYFIATETGLANTLQRSFSWSCNLLWPQELEKSSSKIFLGGLDIVYDSYRVKDYLMRHGFDLDYQIHFMDSFQHGECLIKSKGCFDVISEFINE